jgi:hypothetical protein
VGALPEPHQEEQVRAVPAPEVDVPDISTSATFQMADLALLHHWTCSTSRSLVNSAEIDRIWQVNLPQIGFRYSFVMHAVMSLAALHMAYLDPTAKREHVLDAIRHHNLSLHGFRNTIDQLNDANADALFACSAINFIYIFGISGTDDENTSSSQRKSRLLGSEWIPMVRGVRAVLDAVMRHVRGGPLGELVNLDDWEDVETNCNSTPDDDRFHGVRTAWENNDDASLYDKTLLILRQCYLYVVRHSSIPSSGASGKNKAWAGPLIFLFMAPEEYLTRLHQRQPAALVLLVHFCAVLHEFRHFWFLHGWPRDIVEAVDDILGDYWNPWMSVPREAVRMVL